MPIRPSIGDWLARTGPRTSGQGGAMLWTDASSAGLRRRGHLRGHPWSTAHRPTSAKRAFQLGPPPTAPGGDQRQFERVGCLDRLGEVAEWRATPGSSAATTDPNSSPKA